MKRAGLAGGNGSATVRAKGGRTFMSKPRT